jgi:hypothetical protein
MSFRFHPDAELEFWDAIQYYEEVDQGLGHDFAVEVYSAVQRAVAYPCSMGATGRRSASRAGSKISLWCSVFRRC